jgi:hypothetical protein
MDVKTILCEILVFGKKEEEEEEESTSGMYLHKKINVQM